MDVALTTEGTYPHNFGGVSVWCDQIIRGMPEHDFQVVALVATGAEPVLWDLPDNVASVVSVPMWGAQPSGRKPGPRARRRFAPVLRELIDVLLDPAAGAQQRFGEVLRAMFEYAQHQSLTATLASEDAVRLLSDAWRTSAGSAHSDPTLQDALTGMQLLEHSLRPLSWPPMRADVVHAVTNGLGALPAVAAKWSYGTPMLVTEHGIYLREQFLTNRRVPYRWPVKALFLALLRRLTVLGYHESETITPGNVYNQRWEKRLGADPAKIRTVYNGVDPADFPALDGEPGTPTLSWAGRIDPIKDLETLLRAFALVRAEMPEARLRIFGAPPKGRQAYLDRCKALAAELGIGEVARFEGRVAEIRDAYAAGNVVVLSSISEGFPYTLIEAMTCGRPCVGTDVGGVREAVADTGLVVPPRDPAEMAQACLTLLRDADLRHRLGAAARARALGEFTVDRAVSTFDEIYSFLAAGRRPPYVEDEPEADTDPGELLAEVVGWWRTEVVG
jgi:glycosyltransferase involved in cell wall biosynthesis